ncbi:hypothetical protein N7453_006085 [Penicillium expansum]|nr:hypothetical protein N7453_006085 [Penicillium expansum]
MDLWLAALRIFYNNHQRPFKMKYLAAYLLLALAGNEAPSAADIKAVLLRQGPPGADLRGLCQARFRPLRRCWCRCPAAAAAGGAAAPAEEKVEEKEEESDEDMGFGLFD